MKMELAVQVLVLIVGLSIGSFLNVQLFRRGVVLGPSKRSLCDVCARQLRWFELVPLLSFLFQQGRCRSCGARLSVQHVLVELSAAITLLYVYTTYGITLEALLFALIGFFLILMFVYDMRHKIIPNEWVWPFNGFSFPLIFVGGNMFTFHLSSLIFSLSGALLLFGFFGGIWFVSRGRWMGFADAKLGIGIGFLVGLSGAVSVLLLSFWIGALVSLGLVGISKLQGREMGMKSEVPFGPFLITGLILVHVFDINLVLWYL